MDVYEIQIVLLFLILKGTLSGIINQINNDFNVAQLAVCVRKRPLFKKEEQAGQIDSVSAANPQIKIHQPKFKVDGITKYIENHLFTFDNTFNQVEETKDIYHFALKPLMSLVMEHGIVTCFAYGQTGSGKTYTMNGMHQQIAQDLFSINIKKKHSLYVSFYEIYGGRCLDLLNGKAVLNILQDKTNSIKIAGLVEEEVKSPEELLEMMHRASSNRTTHATVANDTSSRSHAVCQITIKKAKTQVLIGKFLLVDLAGSQRAQDTQSNDRQRRIQGAQINRSLLALKECIRAMGDKAEHVPFRATKLTLILRDSFITEAMPSKIVMIACISPGSSSADHSLNTLRYAERLKDQTEQSKRYSEFQDNPNQLSKAQSLKVMAKNQQTHALPSALNQNHSSKKHPSTSDQKISSGNHLPSNINLSKSTSKGSEKPPSSSNPIRQPVSNDFSKNQDQLFRKQPQKIDNAVKKEEPYPKKEENVSLPSVKKEDHNKHKGTENSRPHAQSYKKSTINNLGKNGGNNSVIGTSNQKSYISNSQLQFSQQQAVKLQWPSVPKDDIASMKRTMKTPIKEEFFAFQQSVSSVIQSQEEVFATHMAAIKEDARLLSQESQLVSAIQGIGFLDYDADDYVAKLQAVIKRKMKMYALLSQKVEGFKKCLREQQQIRHKVKGTTVYY